MSPAEAVRIALLAVGGALELARGDHERATEAALAGDVVRADAFVAAAGRELESAEALMLLIERAK